VEGWGVCPVPRIVARAEGALFGKFQPRARPGPSMAQLSAEWTKPSARLRLVDPKAPLWDLQCYAYRSWLQRLSEWSTGSPSPPEGSNSGDASGTPARGVLMPQPPKVERWRWKIGRTASRI